MNIHLVLMEKMILLLLNFQFHDKSIYVYTQLKTNSVSEWAGIISSEKFQNEETDFQILTFKY